MSLATDIKSFYQRSGILIRFILINLFVFITLTLVGVFSQLSNNGPESLSMYLAAPSHPDAFLHQPWSAFTYMFTHVDFMHFLFNMLMLYFTGLVFTDMLGSRKFPGVYVLGGLAGFALYFLSYNVFPALQGQFGLLLGASASVMAVFVGVGSFRPQYQVHLLLVGPVKLYVLVLIYVLLDLARLGASAGNPLANSGGWLAHIGGAAFGFWFGSSFRKGKDITAWYDRMLDKVKGWFTPRQKKKKHKSYMHVHTATGTHRNVKTGMTGSEKQERIDAILDKISKSGYESLNAKEKEFLFKHGKDV